jgi:hypothetical protein
VLAVVGLARGLGLVLGLLLYCLVP